MNATEERVARFPIPLAEYLFFDFAPLISRYFKLPARLVFHRNAGSSINSELFRPA